MSEQVRAPQRFYALTPPPQWLAVLLDRTPHGNLHLGLHYRLPTGESAAVHHGWQDPLQQEWDLHGLYAVPAVDDIRLRTLALRCGLVAKRYKTTAIKYAMCWRGSSFDRTGALILGPGEQGLTCATFVLALFKSDNFDLIDLATWPDRPELAAELAQMAVRIPPAEVAQNLAAEAASGVVRILPEEVFGAALHARPPVQFAQAQAAGSASVARLDAVPQIFAV